ncbi:MAG: hypothetical protein ABH859_06090 [Pseudomonadota bacterium]
MFAAGEDNRINIIMSNVRGMSLGCNCLVENDVLLGCTNQMGTSQGCDYFAVADDAGQTYWSCATISNSRNHQFNLFNLIFGNDFQAILHRLRSLF